MIRRSPISTLFPYTTLFRSVMRSAMAAPMFLAVFLAILGCGGGGGAGGKEESPPPDAWTPGTPVLDFGFVPRSEEHTSELQSRLHLVCRLLLEKKNIK